MSLPVRIASITTTMVTAIAANVALLSDAHAYIDPGTGTMLLQMVGAMIAAGLFYLRGAKLWLGRLLGLPKSNDAARNETEADKQP